MSKAAFFPVCVGLTLLFCCGCSGFAGGSGTKEDPWQVATAGHLDKVRNYLGEENKDKHFIQTADIDLGEAPWNTGPGWEPIGGKKEYFHGLYDGGRHSINNLTINNSISQYVGLFGCVQGTVRNLGLENIQVIGMNEPDDNPDVQAEAGGDEEELLEEVYREESHDIIDIGGLAGRNLGTIRNCYSKGTVSRKTGRPWVDDTFSSGGMVGHNRGLIENCFSMAQVKLVGTFNECGGGLVGYNCGRIRFCYSVLEADKDDTNDFWAMCGSLVGLNDNQPSITDCYWTIGNHDMDGSQGGLPRDEYEMTEPHSEDTYTEWNWRIWKPDTTNTVNGGYPYFRPLGEVPQSPPRAALRPFPGDKWASVPTDKELVWQIDLDGTYPDPPDGFKLYLGTDNPPTNLANGIDLGYTNRFDPNPELNLNETYYWQVIPYNRVGKAANCPVWSFTTCDTRGFAGGSGTKSDPWMISSPVHLYNLRYYLKEDHADKFYAQTADIDLGTEPWNAGPGWEPIGYGTDNDEDLFQRSFCGNYDGYEHTIRNLRIDRLDQSYQGLFGHLAGSVKNLILENAYVRGSDYVGNLAGYVGEGRISGCCSSGTTVGTDNVGGLVGGNHGLIDNCDNKGEVQGNSRIGGVVGNHYDQAINKSGNTGRVLGKGNVGGVVGSLHEPYSTLADCENSGYVTGHWHTGGVAGYNAGEVTNCKNSGYVWGEEITGGVVGYMVTMASAGGSNSGIVIGTTETGGVVGFNHDGYVDGSNSGIIVGKFCVGGLVGYDFRGATYGINTGKVIGGQEVGDLVGTHEGYPDHDFEGEEE